MVATLLSLKLRLTVAELKRSTARLVIWIILALYALALVGLALVGLAVASLAVRGHEALTASLTVVVGSVVTLGWIVLPLVFFGSDQTLDPARFSQFPLKGSQLAPGLVLAGIVGLPGLFTAVLGLGGALPWLGSPAVFAVGLVGGILGWLTTQLWCRTASAGLSGALSSRKAKDLTGLIGLVVVLLLSLGAYGVSMAASFFAADLGRWQRFLSVVTDAGAVLSWTPLGAPWALVGDAGQGQWLLFAGHLIVTCGYLAVGAWAFSAILSKALVTPAHVQESASVTKGDAVAKAATWFWATGRLTPVAAITARCLRYWRRDPRYLGQIPAVLLIPVLFTVMGWAFGSPSLMGDQPMPAVLSSGFVAFGLGFAAVMAGYALSADVASDATAWWIHLASGVKGWQDRLGRVLAELVWAVPLVVVVSVVMLWVTGHPDRIPAAIGAAFALYLAGLAVASVFSALIIYPMPLPGESPLRMRSAMLGSQMLSQFGCMVASGLLGLPVGVWALFSHGWQDWLVLAVGLVWGVGLLVVGVVVGGKVMDARGPAILLSLRKNDSRERG